MPSGTGFKPVNCASFTSDKLNFNGQGVLATAAAGTGTSIDYTLADDCLAQGVQMFTKGANFGDFVTMQVIDKAGTFTGTAGTVLNQFGTNWYVPGDNICLNKEMLYPAKVLAGMTMRIVYNSTGVTNVQVAINYSLHKVLV